MFSIKNLMNKLNITREQAICIRGILTNEISPLFSEKAFNEQKQAYSDLNAKYLKLIAIDDILNNFDVECIQDGSFYVNKYYGSIVAEYSNTGDVYCNTILFDTANNKFRIISFADFIELAERNKNKWYS